MVRDTLGHLIEDECEYVALALGIFKTCNSTQGRDLCIYVSSVFWDAWKCGIREVQYSLVKVREDGTYFLGHIIYPVASEKHPHVRITFK